MSVRLFIGGQIYLSFPTQNNYILPQIIKAEARASEVESFSVSNAGSSRIAMCLADWNRLRAMGRIFESCAGWVVILDLGEGGRV